MSAPVVFYAWQNDRPRKTTRDFIHKAAHEAICRVGSLMRLEDSPRLDHDTKDEAGSPAIAETILRKIKHSAILLADLTYCSEIRDEGPQGKVKKKNPNPNVMLELGYGAALLGWNRMILILNEKYGGPQWLPFDLKNHRFPITYELGPNSDKGQQVIEGLIVEIEQQVRGCLMAQYDLVDATLARLSSHSRYLMKKHGPSNIFYEKRLARDSSSEAEQENRIMTVMDLSIAQMLELSVIQCVDAATEVGVGYVFTYLGKQCCYKLGVYEPPALSLVPALPRVQPIVSMPFLDALEANRDSDDKGESNQQSPNSSPDLPTE